MFNLDHLLNEYSHIISEELMLPQSAVAVIIDSNNRILLGKAIADDDRDGTLCFPGGGIHTGETPYQAAVREALEETGIIANAIQGSLIKAKGLNKVAFIRCSYRSGTFKPNKEFAELNWHDLSSLPIEQVYPNNVDVLRQMKLIS